MGQVIPVDGHIATIGLALGLFLAVCAAVLLAMWDRQATHVVRKLWCFGRRQNAMVEFVERTHGGLTTRSIGSCSLRGRHERCGEGCRYLPLATPRA